MKLILVTGARPNFVKIAPIVRALEKIRGQQSRCLTKRHNQNLEWRIVHTGQHYDYEMSQVFFEELDIPEPDYHLNAGAGTHAEQTAKIMVAFERICAKEKPDLVVVLGDVNSTLACSITAKKLGLKVAHIEAGLRSGDMTMPEEINRIVTDAISDFLFVTEESAVINLKREGKKDEQIFFVGNIMIDTLYYCLRKLENEKEVTGLSTGNEDYAVATLHRPSNVDNKKKLRSILSALVEISTDLPIYLPLHPRTKNNIENFKLNGIFEKSNIRLMEPLSYFRFIRLLKNAKLVITDSGGIQEEATVLGIPCFTVRENTERPVTVDEGTNTIVGTSKRAILNAYRDFKSGSVKKGRIPKYWDGMTADRIVNILLEKLRRGGKEGRDG
ncbi:MAG: UDP-N-acetylglucosamine 2-epimerase (non-hydrolyzing) [Deltaproteobacteria bacterium]|nr:UDP-N-acetylglucosamine 2-epimerase (non-hydrolyzing) [Deltaproteobacteria bacterium]